MRSLIGLFRYASSWSYISLFLNSFTGSAKRRRSSPMRIKLRKASFAVEKEFLLRLFSAWLSFKSFSSLFRSSICRRRISSSSPFTRLVICRPFSRNCQYSYSLPLMRLMVIVPLGRLSICSCICLISSFFLHSHIHDLSINN